MNRSFGIIVAASIAATAPWLVAPGAAAPISSLTGLQNTMTRSVEAVQYRRGGYRGRGIGGIGLGLGAGALIGGAIIGATRPYGYYGYGPYDPSYYDQGYISAPPTWAARKLPIVSSASDPTTRPQAPTSASTACAIHAREDGGFYVPPGGLKSVGDGKRAVSVHPRRPLFPFWALLEVGGRNRGQGSGRWIGKASQRCRQTVSRQGSRRCQAGVGRPGRQG